MGDRRKFLKQGIGALAGAAALHTTGLSVSLAQTAAPDFVMIVDLGKCNGCDACVIACKARNKTAPDHFLTRIIPMETGTYPRTKTTFVPVHCNQCEDAPCVAACPEDATFKLENGVVFTDWSRCTGRGDCVPACPYNARLLDPRFENKSDKCDFCLDRLQRGLLPSCVESCAPGAKVFGDRKHPTPELAEYLKRTDLIPAKPELQIRTRVLYVPGRKEKAT